MVKRRANMILYMKGSKFGEKIFTNKIEAKKYFMRMKNKGFSVRNRSIVIK